ncbi:MAG: CTP synthase, partial [Prolixibacteraceae bacterium]|nr:CTP synthase [Prolixibacteraceae bacterium]
KQLLEAGVQPDILVLRTEYDIDVTVRKKVALFCNVALEAVVQSINVPTIYDVPLKMLEEKLDLTVLKKLDLAVKEEIDLSAWNNFLIRLKNPTQTIEIGLVGKYVELRDAYKSIAEALIHAGAENSCVVNVNWIHSESIKSNNYISKLSNLNGIIVAPGFGHRGMNGKILAAKFAREKNVPYLGICLGMQVAVIEFAINVLKLNDANSTEMSPKTPYPVIDLMEHQKEITDFGGTMRLGSYECRIIEEGSKVSKAYNKLTVFERHRHRYEFNDAFRKKFIEAGMVPVGVNPETDLVEIIEIPTHKWFVGVQFHPEYRSTVLNPHPLFVDFIKNSLVE